MATREEWCSNQISKLLSEDLRISTLNEIKNYFSSLPQNEAIQLAKSLQLSSIFDCLNDSNNEQVELACEVLTTCMSNLSLGDSTNRYSLSLERALNHPYSPVKIMALKEIQRNVTNPDETVALSKRTALMNAIIKCIQSDDLSVVKLASNIICNIGLLAIEQLLTKNYLKAFHDLMTINGVIRLRVNEMLINISCASDSAMQALESVGLLSPILQDLDNNDVLLKMNVIELLSQLVVTKHGYTYLQSHGIIDKILKHFDGNEDPLTLQLCEPGILKFFGHMAFWKPTEIISKYPAIIDKLFSNIDSEDLTLVGVSLDTLGHIAETNEGKYALESTGDTVSNVVKIVCKKLSSFPTDLRIRALNCLENIIRVTEFDSRVTNLIRKWYGAMGDNPMEMLHKYAESPFFEIRLAGLGILNAMATHHWAQECFKNTAGFIEFLLDRRIERFKECKEIKYDIVKTISTSTIFDHSTQLRLQQFVKEGPFYVEAITEVAVEGEA